MGKSKTALIAICIFVSFAASAFANDSTIPCNAPPDSGASVAVHPGTQVSTTQDKQKKTCIFSINGAVATSPPANDVLQALNEFRDPKQRFAQDPKLAAFSVAALAASTAPVGKVPPELIDALTKDSQVLMKCLTNLSASHFSTETYRGGDISCVGIRAYQSAQEKTALVQKRAAAVSVPTLAISINWGKGRFYSTVYLPTTMIGAPSFNFR
ncbi:MAG: hypothetical protein JSR61_17600 [Proteobacteria bacterium]|nr:hypothetical protein [Pseudomonadota bacterium]